MSGECGEFRLCVPARHPSLPGHFPGQPVVPGVLILDALLAAVRQASPGAGCLRGLPQVKFIQPLLPEQNARIEWQRSETRVRFRVLREDAGGDVLLASGDLRMQTA